MLLIVLIVLFYHVHCSGVSETIPCSFPLPLDLPTRNDRSEQCWLRIEDKELTETLSLWCYIAHGFLASYIHDYNTKKMTEDNADVSLWGESPKVQEAFVSKTIKTTRKGLKDSKYMTVLDPLTNTRLYVTKSAICRLIMYNRNAMSNYIIGCEKILSYVNERLPSAAVTSHASATLIALTSLLLYCYFY